LLINRLRPDGAVFLAPIFLCHIEPQISRCHPLAVELGTDIEPAFEIIYEVLLGPRLFVFQPFAPEIWVSPGCLICQQWPCTRYGKCTFYTLAVKPFYLTEAEGQFLKEAHFCIHYLFLTAILLPPPCCFYSGPPNLPRLRI